MSLRARRLCGALLLSVLTALPVTIPGPATATATPSSDQPKVAQPPAPRRTSAAAKRKGTVGRSRAARPAAATSKPAVRKSAAVAARAATGQPTKKAPRPGTRRKRAAKPPPGGVWARHAIVLDPATDEVLFEKNAGAAVPIASLTKLMTALVFVEQRVDLERTVPVTTPEIQGGGRTRLLRNERLALGDLLHMSLMCSDNVATRVLVRESGLTAEDFLGRMNRKAVELGLARTRFVEFTGLDARNVSTAADCARLLRAAAEHPLVHEISVKRAHEFRSSRAAHQVANTNRLLYGRYEVRGGKTGFIGASGYCLATWIRTEGRDRIAVVLGAPTAATRFADVMRLLQRTMAPGFAPAGS